MGGERPARRSRSVLQLDRDEDPVRTAAEGVWPSDQTIPLRSEGDRPSGVDGDQRSQPSLGGPAPERDGPGEGARGADHPQGERDERVHGTATRTATATNPTPTTTANQGILRCSSRHRSEDRRRRWYVAPAAASVEPGASP
jgi:hypothetical protein